VDDSEVAGPYFPGVILEESFPILTGSAPDLFHVFAYGMFVQLDAQFEQLPLDLLRLPERILLRHLPDEVDGLLRDARLVALGLGFPSPVPAKQVTVPSKERLGLHNMQG
jgi:hypothetical protein